MCTLTFVPKHNNGFILTSNRDEAPDRATLSPEVYEINGSRLLYPKDVLAGGTWIGVSDKERLVCLLNGGFTAHEREDSYRMSRGIIVTDLLLAQDPLETITHYDFEGVEPFTVVLLLWHRDLCVYELVWDGIDSHFSEKPLIPQIWSSSLLYSEEIKKKREQWFSNFLFDEIDPTEEAILHFHKSAGEGNPDTDLIMDRVFVRTKSITQIKKEFGVQMRYEDLQKNSITIKGF